MKGVPFLDTQAVYFAESDPKNHHQDLKLKSNEVPADKSNNH